MKRTVLISCFVGGIIGLGPGMCAATVDWSGSLVSVESARTVPPGTSLTVTVTVLNTGYRPWQQDWMVPSWMCRLEWTSGRITEDSIEYVEPGEMPQMRITIDADEDVMNTPGWHSVSAQAFYRFDHSTLLYEMDNSPMDVSFRVMRQARTELLSVSNGVATLAIRDLETDAAYYLQRSFTLVPKVWETVVTFVASAEEREWPETLSGDVTRAFYRVGYGSPPEPTVISVVVSGPDEVSENSSADYTATALWDDASTEDVTDAASWSPDSGKHYFSVPGHLVTGEVTCDEPLAVSASYGGHTSVKDVIIDNSAILTSVTISGPDEVSQNSSAYYMATAHWEDGSADVTDWASWSPDSGKHYFRFPGYLVSGEVTSDESITLTASYEGKSGSKPVVVKQTLMLTSWSKTFGGTDSDRANSVQQTSDGGYILAGSTKSFDAGGFDVYLVKADEDGNEVWSRTFGGSEDDRGESVQQTSDGGYIVAGWTESYGAGQEDVYLIKTDASGDEVWSRTFGGSDSQFAYSVQQTSDGGYIVAGWTVNFDAGAGYAYLIKTDAEGNEVWSSSFGGTTPSNWANSVQQTLDGGYILAGHRYSSDAGVGYACLIKTDQNGSEVWSSSFGGGEDDYANSVQQTSDGGYIVAGYTNSFGAGGSDVYLIRTDADGNEVWSRTFGGSEEDHAYFVRQTSGGGYVVAGSTRSFGAGSRDVYLIKTDRKGNEVWSKTFGGTDYDEASSVQQTSDGGYIVAGSTYTFGSGRWDDDVYLIKTDRDGNAPPPRSGMRHVPGGSFQMGDNYDEGQTDDVPVHAVDISDFYMDKYHVTKALWDKVYGWAGANGYSFHNPGSGKGADHPVHTVNWYDAVKWCNARSEKEGLTPVYYTSSARETVYRSGQLDLSNDCVRWDANGYRLPTEAEWEKAARGGLIGHHFPWESEGGSYTDHIDGSKANYADSGDPYESGDEPWTTPVGYYDGNQTPPGQDMANGYGLYDMAGNVYDWCWDWYQEDWYSQPGATENDTRGPDTGADRVGRGCCWRAAPPHLSYLRCAGRDYGEPGGALDMLGFRCVRSP